MLKLYAPPQNSEKNQQKQCTYCHGALECKIGESTSIWPYADAFWTGFLLGGITTAGFLSLLRSWCLQMDIRTGIQSDACCLPKALSLPPGRTPSSMKQNRFVLYLSVKLPNLMRLKYSKASPSDSASP